MCWECEVTLEENDAFYCPKCEEELTEAENHD